MRHIVHVILLLGNMLTINKNTTRSCYVILHLVKLEPDMSYGTQVRLREMHTGFIVTKCAHILQLQNMHILWRSKTCTRYGEAKRVRIMENHKKWFWCMSGETNKKNRLRHQDLGPIVIFQHHQEQHLKQPCLNSQEHNFHLCCNMDTIRRL